MNARASARTWLILLLAALGACQLSPPRPVREAMKVSDSRQEAGPAYLQREAEIHAMASWRLQGRVAFSSPAENGSGSLSWQVDSGSQEIRLSAPVSRRSWRLWVDRSGAHLDGGDQGQVDAEDSASLLASQWGFELSLDDLAAWVRGIAVPGAVERIELDDQGRPQRIEQHDWSIDYRDWLPPSRGVPAMPRRVFASRALPDGMGRVRIVVDHWQISGSTAE